MHSIIANRFLRPKQLVIVGGIVAVVIAVAAIAGSGSAPGDNNNNLINNANNLAPSNVQASNNNNNFQVNNSPSSRAISFKVYQEPTVGAFAMLIPSGWSATSALVPHYGTFNPMIAFQMVDDSATKSITFQEYAMPDFTDPSLDALQRPEGTWLSENFNMLYHYLSAQEYTQVFMPQQLAMSFENIQLTAVMPVTDPWRTQQAPGASIADAFYTATRNGVNYDIAVSIFTIPSPGGLIWNASYFVFAAPQGQLDEVLEVYSLALPTYRPNPDFLLGRIKQAGAVSSITTQTSAEIRAIYGQAFANQQESQSRISEKWSEAILGTMDVRNPRTGAQTTVSSDFRFWWTDGLGNVIATNNEGSPDPLRDLTLLEPVST